MACASYKRASSTTNKPCHETARDPTSDSSTGESSTVGKQRRAEPAATDLWSESKPCLGRRWGCVRPTRQPVLARRAGGRSRVGRSRPGARSRTSWRGLYRPGESSHAPRRRTDLRRIPRRLGRTRGLGRRSTARGCVFCWTGRMASYRTPKGGRWLAGRNRRRPARVFDAVDQRPQRARATKRLDRTPASGHERPNSKKERTRGLTPAFLLC